MDTKAVELQALRAEDEPRLVEIGHEIGDDVPVGGSAAAVTLLPDGAETQLVARQALGCSSLEAPIEPTLKQRRPDARHKDAFRQYWDGQLEPTHPFAVDTARLHRGTAYRSALVHEHRQLRRFAGDGEIKGEIKAAQQEPHDGSLPLVMALDGAWECHANVGPVNWERNTASHLRRISSLEKVSDLGSMLTLSTDEKTVTENTDNVDDLDDLLWFS